MKESESKEILIDLEKGFDPDIWEAEMALVRNTIARRNKICLQKKWCVSITVSLIIVGSLMAWGLS